MSNKMILGITGSIGSGKTTATNMFKRHGFEVINADNIYHKISKPNELIYKKIVEEFGNEIINSDKTINREKLKKIVFSDDKKLKKLNSVTHPIIISEIKKLIEEAKNKNIIVDAPLLLESNAKNLVDKIIVVKCNDNIRIQRLLKKGKHTKEEIKNITKSQMQIKEKLKYADFVVYNNGELKHLEKQVVAIIKNLKQ